MENAMNIMLMVMMVAVIGIAVAIPTITGVISDITTTTYAPVDVIDELFFANYSDPYDTVYRPIVNNSDDMWCFIFEMEKGTDYSIDNANGIVTFLPFYAMNESFISDFDIFVELEYVDIVDGSEVVYNCSNETEVFDPMADYEMDYYAGEINVSSTWNMENNTEYCTNYTYNFWEGIPCAMNYTYTSATNVPLTGTTATIIDLIPLLFAVFIIVILVGYMGFKKAE